MSDIPNIPVILGSMAFFGLAHSLTAGLPLKGWMQRALGERAYYGLYRLLYNLLAALSLVPALAAMALLPDRTLYAVPLPWSAALLAVQATGAVGVIITLMMTDLPAFAGLRQLVAFLSGEALPLAAVPFREHGPYALVRHPLYLFSLLFLWATPIMTANVLLFNLGATAYFVIGTFPEERKLLGLYGERYRAYRARVPRLLPLPRPHAPLRNAASSD